MHYVLHAKWSEKGVRRRNVLNGREITLNFRQNRLMLAILEFLGLFLTLENVCTMFCIQNGMKRAIKRRNILNGREITHNFRQNRPTLAILEFLGLF